MSQEVKKGPFAALTIESSKKFYFNVFPETNLVLFTRYQRNFIRESLRENFGPMRNALDRSYWDRHLKFIWQNILVLSNLLPGE